tara:strand:- start:1332 stop:2240 length:909 start_codon:yes stop_codon:yes gene_type:complete
MSLKGKGKASTLVKEAKNEDNKTAFANAKAKAFNQRKRLLENNAAFMLCGVSGDPGTGKTGLAIDCRTEEEKETHWVFILDFDEGAEPTWRQHWSSDDKVFIYNPHVYKEDMTVDYLATADMARFFMGMVKEAIETKQIEFGDEVIEVEGVKSIVFDGLDTWLDTTNMIARQNHIKGGDPRLADKVKMVPTQWFARTQEYQRLFKAACQLECHKFFITHMKEVHDGFEVVGTKPDWEKSTTAKLFQHVHTFREERNGTTKLYAKVLKSKTNAKNEGQTFTLFENSKGEVTWEGLKPLKENDL